MPNPPASAVQKVVDLVPRILYACRRLQGRSLSTGRSLSPQQALILDQLDAETPTTLQALAAQMSVTAPTMSVAIGRLVREGYVRRNRDSIDGRRLDLTLSPAGVRVRKSTSSLDPQRVAALLGRLSAADRVAAIRGLTALGNAARAKARPARVSGRSASRGRPRPAMKRSRKRATGAAARRKTRGKRR
jgi:DNA-binding MarR family transcriptional regulator